MAKRNFAATMLMSIAMLALTNNSRADDAFTAADGCAVLAQLVYSEVTSAAWYGPGTIRPLPDDAGDSRIIVCSQTTRTVSHAFTLAMTSTGVPVRWAYPTDDRGDYCWSGFLDQCYPDRERLGQSSRTWNAVSKIVKRAMPNGIATDQSIFNPSTLRLALRFALVRQRQ